MVDKFVKHVKKKCVSNVKAFFRLIKIQVTSQIVSICYAFNVWYYNLKIKLKIMNRLNVYKKEKNVLNRMTISM